MRKKLVLILKIVVSLTLLAWLFYTSDFKTIISLVKKINVPIFIVAVVVTVLGLVLSALKWKYLLDLYDHDIGYFKLLNIYWSALFFNNFLPSTIGGDVYRIAALSKLSKNRFYSLLTVFLDRFTGAIALTSIASIAFAITYKYLGSNAYIFLGLLIFLIISIILFLNENFVGNILPLIKKLPIANPEDKVRALKESIIAFKKDKYAMLKILGISFVFQFMVVLVNWIVAISLNYNVPFYYFMIFSPVILLISMVPVSFNGLGIREATTVVLFTSVGQLTKSEALLLSLGGYFAILVVSLFGSLTYVFYKKPEQEDEPQK